MRRPRIPVLLPATLALVLAPPLAAQADQSETYQQLQTFSYLMSQVRQNYVRVVPMTRLVRAAIDGVLRSLDPHSRFVTREENDRWLAWESGRLAGTGVVVEDEDGAVAVAYVLPGSPAERVGVLPGDRVLAVNDTLVAGYPAAQVQDRLLGEKGSRLLIRLARGPVLAADTLTLTVRNDILSPRSVTVTRRLAPGIVYVRLAEFEEGAGTEVRDAVNRALAGQRGLGIILDLRSNPGGAVTASVDVASDFLPKGAVVYRSEGRRAEANRADSTTRDPAFADVPLVVLINRSTASAAEVLAGALQDHDRAEILGQRSFGKALEQRLYEVPPNGDAVWLTIAYLHTPSGRLIQRRFRGITVEQYYAQAGHPGAAADTLEAFHTDRGRTVRGGGGIQPDSELAAPATLPLWWSVAADSGFDDAVADSVGAALGGDRASWLDDAAGWKVRVLAPFLARVRARLHVEAPSDSAVNARLALILAARAGQIQWGPDFAEEFGIHNDPEVRAAVAWLERPRP